MGLIQRAVTVDHAACVPLNRNISELFQSGNVFSVLFITFSKQNEHYGKSKFERSNHNA